MSTTYWQSGHWYKTKSAPDFYVQSISDFIVGYYRTDPTCCVKIPLDGKYLAVLESVGDLTLEPAENDDTKIKPAVEPRILKYANTATAFHNVANFMALLPFNISNFPTLGIDADGMVILSWKKAADGLLIVFDYEEPTITWSILSEGNSWMANIGQIPISDITTDILNIFEKYIAYEA